MSHCTNILSVSVIIQFEAMKHEALAPRLEQCHTQEKMSVEYLYDSGQFAGRLQTVSQCNTSVEFYYSAADSSHRSASLV